MKFKIDQNLPIEAADLLAAAGHSEKLLAGHPGAMTVYQQSLGDATDERIVDVCKNEDRILITADLDLSDIRRYPSIDMKLHLWQQMPIGGHFSMMPTLR